MGCAICGQAGAPDVIRVSGLDVCGRCRSGDLAEALSLLGIEVDWHVKLGRFCAGLGIPGEHTLKLWCVPELAMHKLIKLFVTEVQVGDPVFDSVIYVRTSDPEGAKALLAAEGVQSALMALLVGTRRDELAPTHVTLDGPTLTVNVRPVEGVTPERLREYQLETAVLALHIAAAVS